MGDHELKNPADNGEALVFVLCYNMDMGNTVGSRLFQQQIDPVTTDLNANVLKHLAKSEIENQIMIHQSLSDAGFSKSKQQLRAYISGYTDGEGCFSVSIVKRPKLLVGWEVRPSFSVGQKINRIEVLELMLSYFQCGTIRYSSTDKTAHYETRSIKDINRIIIPHFEKYPLLSAKQRDFEQFKIICKIIARGNHLTRDGLREILDLTSNMLSVSVERKIYLQEILNLL